MTTRSRTTRVLIAAGAVAAVLGLGAAGIATAHAQGWGGGPGYGPGSGRHGGMMGGCGGPGIMGGRGGPMMGGMMMGMAGGGLGPVDADADGTITRAEFDAFHDLGFLAMDDDGDGQVARQDFIDARQPIFGGPNANQARADWRAERRATMQGQRFDMWDGDGNGVVTKPEFTAVAASHFAQMDLDKDGAVTAQEMAARRMFGPRGPMWQQSQ